VLHDTCIKAWKKAAEYDAYKGRLFTWLLVIARNSAIDKTRSKEFRQSRKSDQFTSSLHNDISLSESPRYKDVGLHQVLGRLNSDHNKLIQLLYLKGYTQREAAEELDIPLGTVKSRIRKALSDLRKLLADSSIAAIVGAIIEHLSMYI
jgi:RNA polymerase sigma-70 factor (ECF subfamily)